ncbi:GNAT family N-acetyltransferase [Candidatus Woesearchaeota archaeon]|nr:GNAT family N-acetyltransferase [Candidatus Woesearchaeota archaeon]
MVVIKTKRFILRPYRKGDGESIIENLNNKDVSRYMSNISYPYTLKDAKKWIKSCINTGKKKHPNRIDFAIEINGELVGGIDLHSIEKHKAGIGYYLGKSYWKKGVMTQVVNVVTNYGLQKLKLKRIYAYVFSKNTASVRVLQKNGFKYEGLLRKHFLKDRKFSDALFYAKIK